MRNLISAAVIAAGIALAATACSSSLSSNGSTQAPVASSAAAQPSSPAAATSGTAATTIDLQSATGIDGKFLADGQGRALYLFEADKGSTSTCTGACAAAWPPVTASTMPMAGGGLVGLRSGLVTQAVAAPPSLPTLQIMPWCASVTYTLPSASNVNPSRPGCSPVTVMNTEVAPVLGSTVKTFGFL